MGRHNIRLKETRTALRTGRLTPDGLLPVEGVRMVDELDKDGIEIVELFECEGRTSSLNAARRYTLAPSVFQSLSATRNSRGIIALVRPPSFAFESMLQENALLLLVLCRLQDPGNVGNILRIGEAFAATGCVATEGTVSLYNDKVVRASAASLFRLAHVENVNFREMIRRFRSERIRIVGTAMDSEETVRSVQWDEPSAILFGNEGQGLSSEERNACDKIVRIPHVPTVDSLNAASAAAIVLYEAARCRNAGAL